jgi:hypothetical protein
VIGANQPRSEHARDAVPFAGRCVLWKVPFSGQVDGLRVFRVNTIASRKPFKETRRGALRARAQADRTGSSERSTPQQYIDCLAVVVPGDQRAGTI